MFVVHTISDFRHLLCWLNKWKMSQMDWQSQKNSKRPYWTQMLFNAISGQIIEMSIIQIRSCSLILTFFLSLSFPDTEMVSCKQPYWKLRCNAKKKKFRKINANVKCKNVTNLYFNVNAQPMLSGVCTVNVRKRNVPFGKPNTFVFGLKLFGSVPSVRLVHFFH